MSLLVRKIDRAKWIQNDIANGKEVSADAITNCMKTKDNTLSVWKIDNPSHVNDAVLAMASYFDHLDTIDIVVLDESALERAGLRIVPTPGNTPVKRLVDFHRLISELTYRTLGVLAGFTTQCFRETTVHRFTRGQLRTLLKEAITHGDLAQTDLKEHVRSAVIRN